MLHLLTFHRVMKAPHRKEILFYRYTTGDSCSIELYFGLAGWSFGMEYYC